MDLRKGLTVSKNDVLYKKKKELISQFVRLQSPNQPTIPQEKIRPLTRLDHPQSPFFDPEGGAITPLARVVVERIARKVIKPAF